jgi:hypothetical protein
MGIFWGAQWAGTPLGSNANIQMRVEDVWWTESRTGRKFPLWREAESPTRITSENQLFPQQWRILGWNGSGRYSSTRNHTEFVHFAEESGRLEAFFRKTFFVVVLGVVFT